MVRQPQPIIQILSRVAMELNDLAKTVDQLHSLVGGVEESRVVRDTEFMRTAQSIDIVEQRLSSLSHFLLELIDLMPPDWEVVGHAAAQKLKLSSLADRLSASEAHDFEAAYSAGELECF